MWPKAPSKRYRRLPTGFYPERGFDGRKSSLEADGISRLASARAGERVAEGSSEVSASLDWVLPGAWDLVAVSPHWRQTASLD